MNFDVVVTGREGLPFVQRCISSFIWQRPGPFNARLTWRDDASSDLTQAAIAAQVNAAGGRFIPGDNRLYQIRSLDAAIRGAGEPCDIVCLLDADDYLLPDALETLAQVYMSRPEIAFTWGSCLLEFDAFRDSAYFRPGIEHSNSPYPESVWVQRTFRQDHFRCFHLRSFRRWLWELIDPKYFLRPDGTSIQASGDSAFIYPMLEMLSDPKHVAFIDKFIYVYRLHLENVWRTNRDSQHNDFMEIRGRPVWSPIPRSELNRLLNSGER